MPPDHHVGVGAQAADVVDAANDDVLPGEFGEELLDLGGLGRPVGTAVVGTEQVLEPEDRPHGVADGVVDLAGEGGLAVAHGSIVPGWVMAAAARWAEAITAGIPTPSYAAPQTASPGT